VASFSVGVILFGTSVLDSVTQIFTCGVGRGGLV